jgi:aerobic-type carbon monoxide dehydrogenase small subunit (CoxS/CutS family)
VRVLLQLSDLVAAPAVTFALNGATVTVGDDSASLLDALREDLGCRSVKDGCSPQGQCGCCTVWVDGAARVACVTPLRRVAGRAVTTVDGLVPDLRDRWVDAFVATGASQCGFCTPGILLRLAALENGARPPTRQAVESALLAHLCRCTGWQSIVEAGCIALGLTEAAPRPLRDPLLAAWRAQLEGPAFQSSGPDVVLGGGGFADDIAPADALVQLGAATTTLAPSLRAARQGSEKVQGRNSTVPLIHPVPLPEGEWALTLQTTWVEPAYVEPDASWCRPGAVPATPLANGGAFGGKLHSPVADRARDLSADTNVAVRVLWSREDVVRHGPKRPPLALGLLPDRSGRLRIGHTAGSADLSALWDRVRAVAPLVDIEEVEVVGPPVGAELRGAVWSEVLAALSALDHRDTGPGPADVRVPGGGRAVVSMSGDVEAVRVDVWAGEVLCPVTLRSYALGAVHQALGLVWSEGIAVDPDGSPLDLTIRSFGILAARDMPPVEVILHPDDRWPVNGSDAVFAATLAAAWTAEGLPPTWPTRRHRHRPRTGTGTATPPGPREEHA